MFHVQLCCCIQAILRSELASTVADVCTSALDDFPGSSVCWLCASLVRGVQVGLSTASLDVLDQEFVCSHLRLVFVSCLVLVNRR